MKIYSEKLDFLMELEKDGSNLLVIESSKNYREIVQSLIVSIEENTDNWILSDNEKMIKKSTNIEVLTSIFELDFENKKFQKAIIDRLYDIAISEKYYVTLRELETKIETYLYELEFEVPYNIKIELSDFKDIIKSGVGGLVAPEGLVERFVEYIKLTARLLNSRMLVLVNVLDCFSDKEWKEIEKIATYEDIYLLCLEKKDYENIKNKVIIDSDWCRVV